MSQRLLFFCLLPAVVRNALASVDEYSLTLLHTAEILGRVLPVHGWGTECALVPPSDAGSCLGTTQALSCVLEYPFCVRMGFCRSCSGGFAAKVKYFEEVTLREPNTLRVDAGNIYFGTLWYNRFRGEGINEFLNDAMFADDTSHASVPMYDAMLVGNLEFVDGDVALADILSGSNTPRLMSNYDWRQSTALSECTLLNDAPCFKDYDVVVKGGRKIGVVGMVATNLHQTSATPNEVAILDEGDFSTTVNRLIFTITHEHSDCNIIIVVSSLTPSQNQSIAAKVPNVDIIVGWKKGSPTYPEVLPNVVTGADVYLVSSEDKGQTVGSLSVVFDDEGKLIGFNSSTSRDYAPTVTFINGVAQTEDVLDTFAWQKSQIQGGMVEELKQQVVGQIEGEVNAEFGDQNDHRCSEIVSLDPDSTCAANFPLIAEFETSEGTLCCPYDKTSGAKCVESCAPTIDLGSDTWEFPKTQNNQTDACCPQRDLFSRGCCPMNAMFEVYGCRHSECPIGSLAADAMLVECPDCDVAFNVGGGYRKTLGDISKPTSNVLYSDILEAFPYQNTVVTFKIRPTTLLEVLQWAVEGYKPLINEGKMMQVSGLRYVWNPSEAIVIRAEYCTTWDRTSHSCTGRWADVLEDRSRLFKAATSNFVSGGGSGYSMLSTAASKVFESTNLGISFAEMVQKFLSNESPYKTRSKQDIQNNCNGYVHNYVEHFKEHPECRMLKTVNASPYKCPQTGMQRCLDVEAGLSVYNIEGMRMIQNGTCSECSGFGECNTDFYTCSCHASLVDGFSFPQQYRTDSEDTLPGEVFCRSSSSSSNHVGIQFAKGEACSELRKEYKMSTGIQATIIMFGLVNIVVGLGSAIFYFKNRNHAIVKLNQVNMLYFASSSGAFAGLMCFLAAAPVTTFTCNAYPIFGTISFASLMTPLCVKSQVLMSLFQNKKLKTVSISTFWNAITIVVVILCETILCLVLVQVAPFKPTIVALKPEVSSFAFGVFCDARDPHYGLSQVLIWTISLLSVNGLLLLCALYYSLRTRRIPTKLNQSKLMAFCVYNAVVVSATSLPASFMSAHDPPVQTLLLTASIAVVVVSSNILILIPSVHGVRTISADTSTMDMLFGRGTANKVMAHSVTTAKKGTNSILSNTDL